MENYRIIVENSITGERYPVLSGSARGDILIALSALVAAAKNSPHMKYFMVHDGYIKQWYTEHFPSDELGMEIGEHATFGGLMRVLDKGGDVYEYLGVSDSLVRERCFVELAVLYGIDYTDVYNKWLNN